MSEDSDVWTKRFSRISTVVSTATAVILAYATVKVNEVETAVTEAKLQLDAVESELRAAESERELIFQIYASVTDTLRANDVRQIRATKNVVDALAPLSLRDNFNAILAAAEDEIYQREKAETGRLPSSSPAPGPTPDESRIAWEEWDIDIFWCSGSGVFSQAQADRLQQAIVADGAGGRIRSRILPDARKASEGLGGQFGYQVRADRNDAAEVAMAEQLASFASDYLELQPTVVPVNQTNPTKWYLSVFVCPEA